MQDQTSHEQSLLKYSIKIKECTKGDFSIALVQPETVSTDGRPSLRSQPWCTTDTTTLILLSNEHLRENDGPAAKGEKFVYSQCLEVADLL